VTTEPAAGRPAPARDQDQLESAALIFAGSPDRTACGNALHYINGYLSTHPDRRPPALDAAEKELLQKHFTLAPGEMGEVESTTYTPLDAPYLELCFLLRDAARALEVEQLTPAERAATAFAWVMRQVIPMDGDNDHPPEFAVRRGWAGGPERARIFLALLQQMGISGCLVMTPGAPAAWACGALVPIDGAKEKQLLLFDHRLGLPLPGAQGPPAGELARAYRLAAPIAGPTDGQQIATLAALRKQPELLRTLTVDENQPYDVGPEQLKEAALRLAPELSALAPRMRTLQSALLPEGTGLRPAINAAELIAQLGSAVGFEGGPDAVRGQDHAPGVLRRFLGPAEGGIDDAGRQQRAELALIPLQNLPRQLQELKGEPGLRILAYFAQPFRAIQLEPRLPRDQILRGQLKEAAAQLSPLLEQYRVQHDLLATHAEVYNEFDRWKEELFKAYGDVGRAQDEVRRGGAPHLVEAAQARREDVWKKGQPMLVLFVDGVAAEPRSAQATYLMALCLHEQAERAQVRADHLARSGPAVDAGDIKAARDEARTAWKDAGGWWDTYTQQQPVSPFSLHARLLHARARYLAGNRARARALLDDMPGKVDPFTRTARLYLAQRLKAEAP